MSRVLASINKNNKFILSLTHFNQDYCSSMKMVKKMIEWKDIIWVAVPNWKTYSADEIDLMKQIWDNPGMFDG
jgi:hypothetical protein